MAVSRRKFIQITGVASAGLLAGVGLAKLLLPNRSEEDSISVSLLNADPPENRIGLREVMFYEKLRKNRIRCEACPQFCVVSPGNRGYCGNKENQDGNYYTLAYGAACAVNIDPIEKKPFFHFLPGTKAFSLSTAGCNFECLYCQNWQISQAQPEEVKNTDLPPQKIVDVCQKHNIPVIAFTYAEPTVFYEYMYDTAKLAKEKGIDSVMVSNGYITEKPLRQLCEHLSAVKIDLKSFSNEFYRKYCNGRLQPVLDTLLTLKKIGIWYEIVVLIIPTLNDSTDEIKKMCNWIKDNLGTEVPLHFSRFNPQYKLTNLPPTPVATLEKAHEIARQVGLKFVYLGNVVSHPAESTYCPNCKKILIKRTGYDTKMINLIPDGTAPQGFLPRLGVEVSRRSKKGRCLSCQTPIPGVWQSDGLRRVMRTPSERD